MSSNKAVDVIIIGGSYAGLSAAMALGRSLRDVLIIDSGMPCNIQTPHSHNFITQDGKAPHVIAEISRAQVLSYSTIKFVVGTAISGKETDDGFVITLQSGEQFTAKKLILATGVKDIMPDIKGFSACWGISVIHCPYCHGYEFRHQKTGIMANGDRAIHLASLVNNLTNDITIFTSGKSEFTTEQLEKLQKREIKIIESNIVEVTHENGHLKNIVLKDGTKMAFTAIYASLPFSQHSEIPAEMGCEFTETGHIKVDNFQQTNIKGVFACGDSTSMMRSLAYAVASGNMAGSMVNNILTVERF